MTSSVRIERSKDLATLKARLSVPALSRAAARQLRMNELAVGSARRKVSRLKARKAQRLARRRNRA